jgi:hypothetical protein
MMKTYNVLIVVLIAFALSSCEKVIDLKLKGSSPLLVIEGNIYDHAGPYTVTLTKSVNFDEPNEYPAVSGADVEISDNHGNSEILHEENPGVYVTSSLHGTPGYIYTLTVQVDDKTYSATSTMQEVPDIESIYIENSGFTNEKVSTIKFNDQVNVDNYYRVIQFINDTIQHDFHVFSDYLYDGKSISYSIFPQDIDEELETGDKVTIWLESVDKGVYEYFRTANNTGNESASPANPTSNISNGALGYFNACSVSIDSIVVF